MKIPGNISSKWDLTLTRDPRLLDMIDDKHGIDTFIKYYRTMSSLIDDVHDKQCFIPKYMDRENSKKDNIYSMQMSPIGYLTSDSPEYNAAVTTYPSEICVYLHDICGSLSSNLNVFTNNVDVLHFFANHDISAILLTPFVGSENSINDSTTKIKLSRVGKIPNSQELLRISGTMPKSSTSVIDVQSCVGSAGEMHVRRAHKTNIFDSYVSFQKIFACLIMALDTLKENGNLILITGDIRKKSIMEFYLHISSYFQTSRIYTTNPINFNLCKTIFIFQSYKKMSDKDKTTMTDIHDSLCTKMPDYDRAVSVNNDIDIVIVNQIYPGYRIPIRTEYISIDGICRISDKKITDAFINTYSNYIREKYSRNMIILTNLCMSIFDIDAYDSIHQRLFHETVVFCKNINLKTKKKINIIASEKYLAGYKLSKSLDIIRPRRFKIISLEKNIIVGNFEENKWANYASFARSKEIILFALDYYKSKIREDILGLRMVRENIRGQLDSSANYVWMDLQEIFLETKYFDLFSKNMVELHSKYYGKNIQIMNGKSRLIYNIHDSPDDIDYHDPELHGTFDSVIMVSELVTRNSCKCRFVSALLLLRPGSNFIININPVNYDPIIISLLYVCASKFQKLYIYRPTHGYQLESIYIIGLNKKMLERSEIISLEKMYNTDDYPTSNIPDYFMDMYHQINLRMVDEYGKFQESIDFISGEKASDLYKSNIAEYVKNIEKTWMASYIRS